VYDGGVIPRPPILLDHLLDDPGLVRRLVECHAPYWPVQRYFASAEEMRALSDSTARTGKADGRSGMVVGPVFRGDWAYDRPLVDGVEPLLHCAPLVDAAQRLFEAAVVRPQIVYVNLTLPMPCGDGGHTDIPAFRGVDRTTVPVWLLVTMGRSGLFERWRVRIATAVAWFYEGEGGSLTYWPDGPDATPATLPPRTNTALVGDNDVMFHRVESVGGTDDEMVRGLTLDSQLAFAGDAWEVRDAGRVLGRWPWARLRVSLSWKAVVFRDADEARVYDEHLDDLSLPVVLDTLRADLARRGADAPPPADPLHDPAFVAALTRAHHRAPTVYPWGRAESPGGATA
jgi:hypothetical protein